MASSKETVDFAKYRTPELFQKISGMLNWKGTFASGFYYALLAMTGLTLVFVVLAGGAAYYEASGWRWIGIVLTILVTGLPISMPSGVIYSLARLIRLSLDNLLLVVDLLLETAKKIAKDIHSVRSGDSRMPSAKELVRGVYSEVFLPILEQIISDQFWLLGRPALFLYRLTLGRLIRLVIQILPDKTLDEEEAEKVTEATTSGLEAIADNETTLLGALTWTQEKLKKYGGRVKTMVMMPCYIVLGVVLMISLAILLLDWTIVHWIFSLGGTEQPPS
ncbi:MAG: hypothetical protein AAF483_31010 [Planctomycetota bacterium]